MLRNFLNLSNCQKMIFIVAWYKLLLIRILLWIWKYKKTRILLDGKINNMNVNDNKFRCAKKISGLVKVASRFVPYSTHLTQALVTEWMLIKVGHFTTLHIDINIEKNDMFEEYAWLEMYGEVIIGHERK